MRLKAPALFPPIAPGVFALTVVIQAADTVRGMGSDVGARCLFDPRTAAECLDNEIQKDLPKCSHTGSTCFHPSGKIATIFPSTETFRTFLKVP